MAAQDSVNEQLSKLEEARRLAQADVSLYKPIIEGILPVALQKEVVVRRWSWSFILDGLSAGLSGQDITTVAVLILPKIVSLLDFERDVIVLKTVIEVSANIYPILFAYVCNNGREMKTWNNLYALKEYIVPMSEDSYRETSKKNSIAVRIAAIKFIQTIVIVQLCQTRDPRLIESEEISLSLAPSDHPLIEAPKLEAEAKGLLDRMLNIFILPELPQPQLLSAILNCCIPIMKRRPNTVSTILNSVLTFQPSLERSGANGLLRKKLELKFIDKSLRIFLGHTKKNDLAISYKERIDRYVQPLSKRLEDSKKRGLSESNQPYKRQRITTTVVQNGESTSASTPVPTPSPETTFFDSSTDVPANGDYSNASLFTLINPSNPITSFDVSTIPQDILVNIAMAGIEAANPQRLTTALEIVMKRYNNLQNRSSLENDTNSRNTSNDNNNNNNNFRENTMSRNTNSNPIIEDDDDDYDPDALSLGNSSNTPMRPETAILDSESEEEDDDDDDEEKYLVSSTFSLPPPQPLSKQTKKTHLQKIIERFIKLAEKDPKEIASLNFFNGDANSSLTQENSNLKALFGVAITDWTKDSWLVIFTRLITRGIEAGEVNTKDLSENANDLSSIARSALFKYFLGNVRDRMDMIVSWLNEEWFNEYVARNDGKIPLDKHKSVYYYWAYRVLDNLINFLEKSDWKVFIRLLSDLPELDEALIERLKSLCIDPERREIGFKALKFLILYRPPVKSICLDVVEDLYKNNTDLEEACLSILKKYRTEKY